MPFNDVYRRQVRLLVRTIPHVAQEKCFALKGGTAINLFYRDMPRLGHIDLTYLPVVDRKKSLIDIEAPLKRIGSRIKKSDRRITVNESAPGTQDTINKLVLRTPDRVQIKIEVTPVLRGCVYDPKIMTVSASTEDAFGFAEMNVLSFADLFAGKIVAALDRQHSRDLFDIHQLLENEGVTAELRH
jgi:predicted nucleotidyltransferase component of viral defense system